jgi:hypothetical protein
MILQVPAFVVKPIVLASAHGLYDTQLDPQKLAFYSLILLPIPHVTPLFILASIRHFSHDIGIWPSVLLHPLWLILDVMQQSGFAWSLFSLYYVCIHSLPLLRLWFRRSKFQVCIALLLTVFSTLLIHGDLLVTEIMQKIVIAHVVLDEIHPTP